MVSKNYNVLTNLAETKGGQKFIDLSVGQYDLTVSQGASYATKRIEALNSFDRDCQS